MAAHVDHTVHHVPQLSNHIDLTNDDDDDPDPHCYLAHPSKRPRTQSPPRHTPSSSFMSAPSPMRNLVPHSSLPSSAFYRPPFASSPTNRCNALAQPSHPAIQRTYPKPQSSTPRPLDAQVIDLTSSPSPPPQGLTRLASQPPLPPDLPPKTPVCIGQLSVTALILYPIPYLQPHNPGETEWAYVRLHYESTAQKLTGQETVHIRTPSTRGPNGEAEWNGESFGVIEQKVADHLGPMLGKGLIRLDAKIRKGSGNLPILPLQLLVYTPKGNIPVVGHYLRQCNLLLDHPTPPYDAQKLSNCHYFNPHNPPPDGHRRSHGLPILQRDNSRWTTPTSSGKSVEVQRSQVDELFKSLKDDDDLPETEPGSEISTKLYPHQKKAITFLLDREKEKALSGSFSSLWQKRSDQNTGRTSWFHLVTQQEIFEPPREEAKGAILADDMGLGKTITCVALVAATHASSLAFGASALDVVPPPPFRPESSNPVANHFEGAVWGMPEHRASPQVANGKGKTKADKSKEKLEADYARCCRIKAKSRATLIICPLSTVSNWEDQCREHWKGEVTVIGGSGQFPTQAMTTPRANQKDMDVDEITSPSASTSKHTHHPHRPLRVYVYHGNARRPEPTFLVNFDVVITTYSTLASEYSKQSRSLLSAEDDDEEDASSEGGVDIDDHGNQILRLPKPKKGGTKRKKALLNQANNPAELPSALQSVHWFRVVLDEAHCIKETNTVASRACCDLMADRRLCLTGTPVQNKLDDVFALIKFLRLNPFDDKNVWTEFIGSPIKFGQSAGVIRLQTIMRCITLRRTKESKAPDGQKILSLPDRKDELRFLKFDPQEQEVYDQFFTESKQEFTDLTQKNEVMKNYVGILQKILRLRQICDHFELVQGKGLGADNGTIEGSASYEDVIASIAKDGFTYPRALAIFSILRESSTTQCVECAGELCGASDLTTPLDESDNTVKRGRKSKALTSRSVARVTSPSAPRLILTKCAHLFCLGCYRNSVYPEWPKGGAEERRSCSACQCALSPSDAVEIKADLVQESVQKKRTPKREKRQKGQSLENFVPSTKVRSLMKDLVAFSRMNPHSSNYDPEIEYTDANGESEVVKTVVFSQWTSMLDKIEDALESAGIQYDRLDGTMKRDDRTRAMDALKHDPACEVLLVSLKAGGVGLNLTSAQRVYLMDPYWNPAVENQAVDRIHRLGQTRPVTTVKLIIENTIEARLLEVQKKKTELADITLGQTHSKQELLERRMDELKQLFDS